MTYRAPVEDYQFIFDHVVGLEQVTGTERFAEATPDLRAAILGEAGRMCEEVLAPLQRAGDSSLRQLSTPAPIPPRLTSHRQVYPRARREPEGRKRAAKKELKLKVLIK